MRGLAEGGSSGVQKYKSSVGGGELGSLARGRGGALFGGDFPGGGVGEEAANQLGVEGVAGFAGFDTAEER